MYSLPNEASLITGYDSWRADEWYEYDMMKALNCIHNVYILVALKRLNTVKHNLHKPTANWEYCYSCLTMWIITYSFYEALYFITIIITSFLMINLFYVYFT